MADETGGGSVSPIPGIDFQSQGKQTAQGLADSGVGQKFASYFRLSLASAFTSGIAWVVDKLEALLALIVSAVDKFESADASGLHDLVSAILADVMGVNDDSGRVQASFTRGSGPGALGSIGQEFLDFLTNQLAPSGTLDPDQGLAAAQNFLGFLIGFAVREVNLEMVTSMIPEEWRIGDALGNYPGEVARNLGLPRLSRVAFTDLIKILLGDPLKWRLNSQYRPTQLPIAIAARAFARGGIDQGAWDQIANYEGWGEGYKSVLLDEHKLHLDQVTIDRLTRWGVIEADQTTELTALRGGDDTTTSLLLSDADLQGADSVELEYVRTLRDQAVAGFIDSATFGSLIQRLHLSPSQVQGELNILGQRLEVPRRRLSLGQIEKAYLDGLITISDFQDFVLAEGYSDRDQLVLVLQLLQKSADAADQESFLALKQAVSEARTEKAAIKLGLIPATMTGPSTTTVTGAVKG